MNFTDFSDIQLNEIQLNKLSELIKDLENRALFIEKNLQSKYQRINIDTYLQQFKELHQKHIDALKLMDFKSAIQYCIELHELSCNIELRNTVKLKGDSAMKVGAGQRGPLISCYMVGDFIKESPKYPKELNSSSVFFYNSKSEQINFYLSSFLLGTYFSHISCIKCGTQLKDSELMGSFKIVNMYSDFSNFNDTRSLICQNCNSVFLYNQNTILAEMQQDN